MTRTELVERVAEHLGVSVASVERVVTEMIGMIADAIVSGEPVLIRAFGTLKTQTRVPRSGYDMHRKKLVTIPEHDRVIFVTNTTLKKRIATRRKAR